jgi:diguanylate cyclase (GGDEF)-like protein
MAYILFTGQRHKKQLVDLASHDGLTGLPNRRRSVEVATAALESAAQEHRPVTIALIDLDHFKMINDRHGHATGDNVLKEFARVGRESLRTSDFLGRWGGEEFIVVLSDMTLDMAMTSIERLRAASLAIKLPVKGDEEMRVSFSAGLATNESGIKTLDDIIAQADVALYEAKSNGRDLVRIADASFDSASTGVRRALRRTGRAGAAPIVR